jgi:hypothetical protein
MRTRLLESDLHDLVVFAIDDSRVVFSDVLRADVHVDLDVRHTCTEMCVSLVAHCRR